MWVLLVVLLSLASRATAQLCVADVLCSQTGCCTTIKSTYNLTPTQIDNLISVHTAADIGAMRQRLIKYVWKQDELPTTTPVISTAVTPPATYFDWTQPAIVQRVDLWTMTLNGGFVSKMYLFVPQNPKTRLIIMHQGHGDHVTDQNADEPMTYLLNRHYPVLYISLPAYGPNDGPWRGTASGGATLHTPFGSGWETPTQSTAWYFLHPIISAVNYALQPAGGGYRTVWMTGVSGGGYMTTLASAIDPRIQRSLEMSGSAPKFLRDSCTPCSNGPGDHEQFWAPLFAAIGGGVAGAGDYYNLYIAAGFDSNLRRWMQASSQWDTVIYSGINWQVYFPTVESIVETSIAAGGQMEHLMDSSDMAGAHQYPSAAMAQLMAWFSE